MRFTRRICCDWGYCRTGYIYPRSGRGVRDLLRKRSQLVRQHTANLLSLRNLYARSLCWDLSRKELRELEAERLMEHFEDTNVGQAAWSTREIIESLTRQIELIEQRVYSQMEEQSGGGEVAAKCAGHREDPGRDDWTGDGRDRSLCASGGVCFLCPLRGERSLQ